MSQRHDPQPATPLRADRLSQPGASRSSPRRTTSTPSRRAFTLVEAALSIAITSILLTAMGAALLMSITAADTGADSAAANLAVSEKLAQMNAELSSATAITTMSANDILFQVPDRNADGVPETIEYTWSGTDGAPVKRSYNGAAAGVFIPSVRSLTVAAIDRPPAVAVNSSEQVLISCDSPSGASYSTTPVDLNNWAAQYARPTLPSGAVSWSITRVRLVLSQSGSAAVGSSIAIDVRAADSSGRPTSTILASATLTSSSLSTSAAWTEFLVGPITGLPANQGVCITCRGNAGSGTLCSATYAQGSSAQPFNSDMMTSTNAGSTWSAPTDTKDMRFALVGTYTTMQEP